MPVHAFIDTNIYLSFYHFTSDDLEELRKLVALLKRGEIVLYLPDQVAAELKRNRDPKIADAIKKFREQRIAGEFPQICRDYPEYKELREVWTKYQEVHSRILLRIKEDAAAQALKADLVLAEIFAFAQRLVSTADIVGKARLRQSVGNPPGKNGSLGDAINWENLLTQVPDHEDLYFISEDSDYRSPLDDSAFNRFLIDEWREAKSASVVFHRRLSAFLKDVFPMITLAIEMEKDSLIGRLAASPSFAYTHFLVAQLGHYAEFTREQANNILSAVATNDQVRWIIRDADVLAFVMKVLDHHGARADPVLLEGVKELLVSDETAETEDAEPF